MDFNVTETMKMMIKEWDNCNATDVSGARLSYTFIPTGLGTIVKVECCICDRELDITEDWG